MKYIYDPECGELARYFLGESADSDAVGSLAEYIQESVEDWLRQPVVEAPPRTRKEAAAFFSRYGNVGRPADLLRTVPTENQLTEACAVALSRGQSREAVDTARRLILAAQSEAEA